MQNYVNLPWKNIVIHYFIHWLCSDKKFNNTLYFYSEGCENGCGNHGNCVITNNLYTCECNDGWEGESCSVRLEMECNDEIDNDQGKIKYWNYY